VIREIGEWLHKGALTVNGRTLWENSKDAVNYDERVITPVARPFKPQGGIAVLRGNPERRRTHETQPVPSHPDRRR